MTNDRKVTELEVANLRQTLAMLRSPGKAREHRLPNVLFSVND